MWINSIYFSKLCQYTKDKESPESFCAALELFICTTFCWDFTEDIGEEWDTVWAIYYVENTTSLQGIADIIFNKAEVEVEWAEPLIV